MGLILAGYPAEPQHIQTVALGGVDFRVRCTWRERTRAWYLDLYAADGTPLVVGRRLSPGWAPYAGIQTAGMPDGVVWVRGPNDYARDDLGASLRIAFYGYDELPSVADDTIRIVV